MGTKEAGKDDLVYGLVADHLVFIPRPKALEMIACLAACASAKTWGEFRSLVPGPAYEVLMGCLGTEEEPEDKAPFDQEDLGPFLEGDWPGWPEQAVLDWMPQAIWERYGEGGSSMVSGDHVTFDPGWEREVVEALERHGYHCVRDDRTVSRATGSE